MNGSNLHKVIVVCLCAFSCLPDTNGRYYVDLKRIVNKRPQEVEAVMGMPDSTYWRVLMGRPVFCQLYRDEYLEIQYPGRTATDIVVSGPHGLPFDQKALGAFGLNYHQQHPSDYRKNGYIRWVDFEAFSSISFYNTRLDTAGRVQTFDVFFKAKAGLPKPGDN